MYYVEKADRNSISTTAMPNVISLVMQYSVRSRVFVYVCLNKVLRETYPCNIYTIKPIVYRTGGMSGYTYYTIYTSTKIQP